jgi:gliding motility-associated-like protein
MYRMVFLSFALLLLIVNITYSQNYIVQQIPFQPISTNGFPFLMSDDAVYPQGAAAATGFDIGFDFCFYGNTYNKFWIGSNGWLSFSPNQSSTYIIPAGVTIPTTTANYPRNCIMSPFEDWLPQNGPGLIGNVYYETRGEAPCRQLVVTFLDVSFFSCVERVGSFQIILYENINVIDNILYTKPTCESWQGGRAIHGLHNLQGTLAAVVSNRNAVPFTAVNEAWRFIPVNMCAPLIDTVKIISQDTATTEYPVINVNCFDSTVSFKLSSEVFCNSVDTSGSDFRIYNNNGNLVQIKKVSYECLDNQTDSLTLTLAQEFNIEKDYFLVQRVGIDGNTLVNCIGSRSVFDTAIIRVSNCYKYLEPVNVTNVSVINNDSIKVSWEYPDTLDLNYFESYIISVSDSLGGSQFYQLAELTGPTDTTVTIELYNPEFEKRDWNVKLNLRYYGAFEPGTSGTHILLSNPDGTLSNGIRGNSKIEWTQNLLWPNSNYKVYESKLNDTVWSLIGNTTDTTFVYEKRNELTTYLLKVEAENPNDSRVSVSNYIRYSIEDRQVKIINVVTPNGDGINDFVHVDGIEFYPNSKIQIFNRWGQRVYESSDYKNDWSPTMLEGGTYYCFVEIFEKGKIEGAIQVIK